MFLAGSLRHTGVSCVVAKLGKTIKSFKENDNVLEYDAPWSFACTSVLKTSNKNEIIKRNKLELESLKRLKTRKKKTFMSSLSRVYLLFSLKESCVGSFPRHGFPLAFAGMDLASAVPFPVWFNDIFCILLLEAPVKRLDPPWWFGSRGRFMTDLLVDHSRFAHERFDGGAAYPRVPFWRMGM